MTSQSASYPRAFQVEHRDVPALSNAEIAQQLYVSPATAKTHVARLLMKLGAATGPG